MSALDAWFARGWCGSEGLDDCPTCTARRACRAEVEEMRAEIARLTAARDADLGVVGRLADMLRGAAREMEPVLGARLLEVLDAELTDEVPRAGREDADE